MENSSTTSKTIYIYIYNKEKKVRRSGVNLRSNHGWITSNKANVRMDKYFDAIPIKNVERSSSFELRIRAHPFIYMDDIQHIDVSK